MSMRSCPHAPQNQTALLTACFQLFSDPKHPSRPNHIWKAGQRYRTSGRPGKLSWTLSLGCRVGAALFAAAMTAAAQGQGSVTLAWNPSPSSGITGYRLYVGPASRVYTNCIVVGNVTTNRVADLVNGATYFFAVTAYDADNAESDFSNEISYTVPPTEGPVQPPATNAPGVALQIQTVSDGSVVLSGAGQSGQSYSVHSSQDLKTWAVVGTVTASATGSFVFTDVFARSRPGSFYRLRCP